jgi:hypothetical protein
MQYENDDFHPTSTTLNYDDDLGNDLDDNNSEEMRYYNEQYGPGDNMSETITVDSQKKKYRKMWDDAKKVDKGYHKIKRNYNHKKVEIEVYTTSNTPGKMIRDAITGNKYNQYRVGSVNEHLFFKVTLATGEIGRDGTTMFFDSPEQYERHMKCEISQAIKEQWVKKCAEYRHIEQYNDDNNFDFVIVK